MIYSLVLGLGHRHLWKDHYYDYHSLFSDSQILTSVPNAKYKLINLHFQLFFYLCKNPFIGKNRCKIGYEVVKMNSYLNKK